MIAGIDPRDRLWRHERLDGTGADMNLYRIEKVVKPGGAVIKKRDILAASDKDAVETAVRSPDCPVCDVLKDGKPIASIA